MDVSTGVTTGTRTIANLLARSAVEHAKSTAVQYKRDGTWHDVTYAELGEIVQEIGLGLIDLDLQPGERLCILANTRPEWSYVDMAATSAGAIVVPIYPTNSPEECLWVISDSDACAIVCENDEQLAKIASIRDQLPNLRMVILIDPLDGGPQQASSEIPRCRRSRSRTSAQRGRSRSPEELEARRAPCARRTPSPSSTPRARPGRRRAACSRTATTARSWT